LAGDDDYLRGATSINHQVALRANFKMYSRSAKGGELKMAAPSEEKLICDKFNLEAVTVNQVKSFKLWQTGKMFSLEPKREVARGATSINHQVALRANFKMYSRSAKGGEKGDPNCNPWLAKMG
jgi:hypothetical protein